MNKITTSGIARFFDNVRITVHCWLWETYKSNGYGYFWFNGKMVRSHRFSYELFVGLIEPGKHILHRKECGNRDCVNPHHLYMGTNTDNMRDKMIWGDANNGERHGRSKLSEADVMSIRKIHKNNRRGYKSTADAFGVDQSLIGYIVRRDNWKHLL